MHWKDHLYASLGSFMLLIVLRALQRTHLLILIFVFVSCSSKQIQREKNERNTAGQLAGARRHDQAGVSTVPWCWIVFHSNTQKHKMVWLSKFCSEWFDIWWMTSKKHRIRWTGEGWYGVMYGAVTRSLSLMVFVSLIFVCATRWRLNWFGIFWQKIGAIKSLKQKTGWLTPSSK